MRLPEFILNNREEILQEWEAFARSIWPVPLDDPLSDPAMLRDHADAILQATYHDMTSSQTAAAQQAKSEGTGSSSATSDRLDHASELHAAARVTSGFEMGALVAEYRALRATVIRLWLAGEPHPATSDLNDLTRFNESIDQSLTEAIRAFTEQVDRQQQQLLTTAQGALKEAENANRAKDTFLATLSHELRNPLAAVAGWVEVLSTEEEVTPPVAEGLEIIKRNTQTLVTLIEEMLDVARIVSGKLRLEIEECDLVRVVNGGIEAVRPMAQTQNVTLEANLDPNATRVKADPTRIQQVVWNLLSNAIKFSPEGGRVAVALEWNPREWRLTVKDNGRGIHPELLPHVFERFRQGEPKMNCDTTGLGLGLSIVKHIADLHGGTAKAFSDGEGQGATFVVAIPCEQDA